MYFRALAFSIALAAAFTILPSPLPQEHGARPAAPKQFGEKIPPPSFSLLTDAIAQAIPLGISCGGGTVAFYPPFIGPSFPGTLCCNKDATPDPGKSPAEDDILDFTCRRDANNDGDNAGSVTDSGSIQGACFGECVCQRGCLRGHNENCNCETDPVSGIVTCEKCFVCDAEGCVSRTHRVTEWSCQKQCEDAGGPDTAYLWDSVSGECGCGNPPAGLEPQPESPPERSCATNADCNDNNACSTDTCDLATNTCNDPQPIPGTYLFCDRGSSTCVARQNTAFVCSNQGGCGNAGDFCTPPPIPQCPSVFDGADTLRAFISATFNIHFNGPWSAGTLSDLCEKLAETSVTNFDDFFTTSPTGAQVNITGQSTTCYVPLNPGYVVNCNTRAGTLRGSSLTVYMFHELSHTLKALKSSFSDRESEISAVAEKDYGIPNYSDPGHLTPPHGHVTYYPYSLHNGFCPLSTFWPWEEYAETMTYYLHPGISERTTVSCSAAGHVPYLDGAAPAHCRFAHEILDQDPLIAYNPYCQPHI